MNRFKEFIKLCLNMFNSGALHELRYHECQICHSMIQYVIRIPSSTGLWVCYDCYSYWVEGYKPEELVFKIKNHYRNKTYK